MAPGGVSEEFMVLIVFFFSGPQCCRLKEDFCFTTFQINVVWIGYILDFTASTDLRVHSTSSLGTSVLCTVRFLDTDLLVHKMLSMLTVFSC